MRTGRGVGERSRRFRRADPDRERPRSFDLVGVGRRRPFSSLSRSLLVRRSRSLDRTVRSFESFRASALGWLLLLLADLDLRLARRSLPLLDDEDELDDDDEELKLLERELRRLDELLSEELLSDELQTKQYWN